MRFLFFLSTLATSLWTTNAMAHRFIYGSGACASTPYTAANNPISIEMKTGNGFAASSSNETGWLEAVGRWNQNPSNQYFDTYGSSNAPVLDNGVSEVSMTNDPNLAPSGSARTHLFYASGCKIDESDIYFNFTASNYWSSQESPVNHEPYAGGKRSLQGLAIHELGHAAGLAHEERYYNVMGGEIVYGTLNGSTAFRTFGEDAADAMINLYGVYNYSFVEDVGASPYKIYGSNGEYSVHTHVQVYDPTTYQPYPISGYSQSLPTYKVPSSSGTFRFEFTLENNGPSYIRYGTPWKIYLSTDDVITTSDTLLMSGVSDIYRDVPGRIYNNIYISGLTQFQTYYVGIIMNPQGLLDDAEPLNNIAFVKIKYE